MKKNQAEKMDFIPPVVTDFGSAKMADNVLDVLCRLIGEQTGISLGKKKQILVETRLSRRLRLLKMNDYQEYLDYLESSQQEVQYFINALTTNTTHFFREYDHFDYLNTNIFPDIMRTNRQKNIRIWSAASSSGEEAYSLGIMANEFFGHDPAWDIKLLGTDVDTEVIQKAKQAIYKRDTTSNVSEHILKKYFLQGSGNMSNQLKIKNFIMDNVKFRQFNLLTSEFDVLIKFDIIFLRNVLIYFETKTIQMVIDKLDSYLKPGGYLFIGHSETLNDIDHSFKVQAPAVYKKPE